MNEANTGARGRRSTSAILLEFFGSMNLAITLLVAIAIASVIGTVLKQNEVYQNYIFKFGPFWFHVFKSLGLYNIYGTPWFIAMLGFLLLSTSVCIYRHFPQMWRDITHFRLGAQENSLRAFHLKGEWRSAMAPATAADLLGRQLKVEGYGSRLKAGDDHTMVAAMKGRMNRLGYLLSHIAIVVICLGALVDGNLPLRLAQATGKIKIETRDLPVAQVPKKSVLSVHNSSFRGSVNIPEGSSADFIFLSVDNGYLVQPLPFTVGLDKFRIEHYNTGMPKSFESDLTIYDPKTKKTLHKTIAVNHPWVYKGYSIYQSSFSDGGSKLQLSAYSFDDPAHKPIKLNGRVHQKVNIVTDRGKRTIELDDFKLYNIFPADANDKSGKKFHNYGPSVVFKVRRPDGEAREFVNYMAPVPENGSYYFLSGVRNSPSEPYRYLHIPVDDKGGLDRFFGFLAMARDAKAVRKVAEKVAAGLNNKNDPKQNAILVTSMTNLVELFVRDGIDAVADQANKSFAKPQRAKAIDSYIKVIQNVLGSLYIDYLKGQGLDVNKLMRSDKEAAYFDDMLNAISLLGPYGSPFYLHLDNFQQIQASGLQITRAPGETVVYIGFVMLMAGVFFLFYLHHRRLWLRIVPDGSGSRILFAGTAQRDRADFTPEFRELETKLRRLTETQEIKSER